jgi:large subunit ribosomal protein L15
MQTNQLKRRSKNRKGIKVGRGGKRGKTSGRGTKGQKARAGRKLRPEERDTIKKIPKLRGYGKNRAMTVDGTVMDIVAVNLSKLQTRYNDGETVSTATLLEKKIISRKGGKLPRVKILSVGEISKKLTIEKLPLSATAKEKIEKAGGSVK